jgi:hypothetical protein
VDLEEAALTADARASWFDQVGGGAQDLGVFPESGERDFNVPRRGELGGASRPRRVAQLAAGPVLAPTRQTLRPPA